MYLKQIKSVGFKSFADEVNIVLSNGMTGIVGPNGSGKSNVVDSIRWVLGEQSIKNLRGEGLMSDIIFSGSSKRKGSTYAKVELIFDNSDRCLPIEFNEVSIKRILYKDGENEFYINNNRCRLKDILDLIMDTGIEKDSYNIISQGEVQNIISNKKEERRTIFDSAAGVLKYKKRKDEAIKKLEKTHDNLSRVNDIINELEDQTEPLKEQKDIALKYLDTRKELENNDIALIAHDISTINYDYTKHKEELETLNNKLQNLNTENISDDTSLIDMKLKLDSLDKTISSLNQELIDVNGNVEKLNGERNLYLERIKNNDNDKNKLKKIELEEYILKLNNDKNILDNIIISNNKKIDDLNKDIELVNNNLNDINKQKISNNNELTNLSRKYNELKYKKDILNNEIESASNISYAVRNVLNNNNLNGIHDIVANIIEFDQIYVDAINISLSTSKEYIITDDTNSAKEAIKYLKNNNLGRATFYPLNVIKKRYIDNDTLNILKSMNGFIDIASNLVKYNKLYENIILNLLGNIIIADNIDNANIISKKILNRYRIVTLDGDVINVGGSLTGGRIKKQNNNIFNKKYELEDTLKDIDKTQELIKDKEEYINELDYNINIINKNLINLEIEKNKLENNNNENNIKTLEIQNNINELENEIKHYLNNKESLEDELIKRYYDEVDKKNKISKELDDATNYKNKLSNEINSIEESIKKSNSIIFKIQNEIKDLEIKINSESLKLDNLLNTLNTEYNITYEKAKVMYHLEQSREEVDKKVKELKNLIKNLGVVNIGAIEEYDRIKTRFDFLNNQKEDLYKAETTLIDIIDEIDKVMKEEFIKTFDKIRDNFKAEFKKLFGGGDADLILTDPDNILETGIEIDACPPGKKLSHISLLSGGEKTLTAICLLFAIIKVKSLPFCVLDEVEAALDDVNVDKFGKELTLLKEKTQFIIVTHKKKTMEYVDYLYGITMQESGVSKFVSVKLADIKEDGE